MGGQAPQTLRPGEVWPPSGWSPVARMSGRRPRRSSPCPRPLSAVRMSVQSVTRTSGVHASGVHATGAIQVSGRMALRCPRLYSCAVRTALDPGMARCRGPSPLGAMGSMCRRGPRAAWSSARMGPEGTDGAGLAVGGSPEGRRQTWTAASHAHRPRRRLAAWPTRELVQRQGAVGWLGSTRTSRSSPVPPQVRPGQVAGVVPDHGAGQGGDDHAAWSLGW